MHESMSGLHAMQRPRIATLRRRKQSVIEEMLDGMAGSPSSSEEVPLRANKEQAMTAFSLISGKDAIDEPKYPPAITLDGSVPSSTLRDASVGSNGSRSSNGSSGSGPVGGGNRGTVQGARVCTLSPRLGPQKSPEATNSSSPLSASLASCKCGAAARC